MLDVRVCLGNVIKDARTAKKLTQREVANLADVDVRTVLNIENFKGNPKIEVLFPLVRVLGIDPTEIFYPDIKRDSPALRDIQIMLSECSEQELSTLLTVFEAMLTVIRNGSNISDD